METLTGFSPLSEFPGYSVNALGQVRSEKSGILLAHDSRGRVGLQVDGKRRMFFLGELAPVGVARPEARIAPENPDLERSLRLARKVNGLQLDFIKTLRRRIAELEALQRAGRKRAARHGDCEPEPFDDGETYAR